MLARALREGVEVLLVVIDEVKKARDRSSDGGRKITASEWRRIMSAAATQLVVGLTHVFAPFLDDEAVGSFSDDPHEPRSA